MLGEMILEIKVIFTRFLQNNMVQNKTIMNKIIIKGSGWCIMIGR